MKTLPTGCAVEQCVGPPVSGIQNQTVTCKITKQSAWCGCKCSFCKIYRRGSLWNNIMEAEEGFFYSFLSSNAQFINKARHQFSSPPLHSSVKRHLGLTFCSWMSCRLQPRADTCSDRKKRAPCDLLFLFIVAPAFPQLAVTVIVPFLMQSLIISLYLHTMWQCKWARERRMIDIKCKCKPCGSLWDYEQLRELKPQHLEGVRSGFYHIIHNAELHVVKSRGQKQKCKSQSGQLAKVVLLTLL